MVLFVYGDRDECNRYFSEMTGTPVLNGEDRHGLEVIDLHFDQVQVNGFVIVFTTKKLVANGWVDAFSAKHETPCFKISIDA